MTERGCPEPRKSCYSRRYGRPVPKIWYRTEEEAVGALLEVAHRHGRRLTAYRCTGGEGWHLGTPRWRDAQRLWAGELGDRAAWCLYIENKGREDERLKHVVNVGRRAAGSEERARRSRPVLP